MRVVAVFDNQGETLDRYTVLFDSGDMLGLSETGAGFSQWCGNFIDNYMFTSFGYAWRRYCDVDKTIKQLRPQLIMEFESEGNMGRRVKLSELSKELRLHITMRAKE